MDLLPILLTDATPMDSLVDRLMVNHERLPVVDARVTLPEAVEVVQFGRRTNGHLVLREEEQIESVMAEITEVRRRHPAADPADEAVVAFKDQRAGLEAAGFGSCALVRQLARDEFAGHRGAAPCRRPTDATHRGDHVSCPGDPPSRRDPDQ